MCCHNAFRIEVQEMAISKNASTSFNSLMNSICKTFGGKHQVAERISDILQFSARFGEVPANILLCWRQAKFALKLKLDYATECDVPARKRLKPSDERLMEALLGSLSDKTIGIGTNRSRVETNTSSI